MQNMLKSIGVYKMFNIISPHKEIMIFKGALKNPQEIIDYAEGLDTWTDWYTFGKMTDFSKSPGRFADFPTKEAWQEKIPSTDDKNKTDLIGRITDTFYDVTKIYFEENGIDEEFLSFESFNLAKYLSDTSLADGYVMNYHTDWQQEKVFFPEYKFFVTCLFYLNDDYDGGEIVFKKLNDSQTEILYTFEYKPEAGDVVVFPSTPPFYHGVKMTSNGEKYLIRTYWKKWKNPDEEWNRAIEKYGAEKWLSMQEEYSKKVRGDSFNVSDNNGTYYFQGQQNILENIR